MPPKSRASGATPRRGRTSATPSPAQPVPPSASSPSGGIARTPSGRFRASVDAKTVGTFDTLEEAAAAITHATMLQTTGADLSPAAARRARRSRARGGRRSRRRPPPSERPVAASRRPAPPGAERERPPPHLRAPRAPPDSHPRPRPRRRVGSRASTRSSAPEAAPVRPCASLASDAVLAELAPAAGTSPCARSWTPRAKPPTHQTPPFASRAPRRSRGAPRDQRRRDVLLRPAAKVAAALARASRTGAR